VKAPGVAAARAGAGGAAADGFAMITSRSSFLIPAASNFASTQTRHHPLPHDPAQDADGARTLRSRRVGIPLCSSTWLATGIPNWGTIKKPHVSRGKDVEAEVERVCTCSCIASATDPTLWCGSTLICVTRSPSADEIVRVIGIFEAGFDFLEVSIQRRFKHVPNHDKQVFSAAFSHPSLPRFSDTPRRLAQKI
jgi:hypothetical protein